MKDQLLSDLRYDVILLTEAAPHETLSERTREGIGRDIERAIDALKTKEAPTMHLNAMAALLIGAADDPAKLSPEQRACLMRDAAAVLRLTAGEGSKATECKTRHRNSDIFVCPGCGWRPKERAYNYEAVKAAGAASEPHALLSEHYCERFACDDPEMYARCSCGVTVHAHRKTELAQAYAEHYAQAVLGARKEKL